MKKIKGKIAAITGAGSGIGQALAVQLAKMGCHLAIADIHEQGLESTKNLTQKYNVKVSTHILNVASKEAVYAFTEEVVHFHERVNILINNAGVSMIAKVEQTEYEDFEWLMNINFWGVVYGTKAFLPLLRKAGEGHIVNVSSLFGLLGVPNQSAYNASKFAVRGFTESLRMELEMYGENISATCVHPGGVKTNIITNSRIKTQSGIFKVKEKAVNSFEKTTFTTAEQAATKIILGIKQNRRRVLIGKDAFMGDAFQRLFPERYQKNVVKRSRLAFVDKDVCGAHGEFI
jgi:short-subunit dehydrogenase